MWGFGPAFRPRSFGVFRLSYELHGYKRTTVLRAFPVRLHTELQATGSVLKLCRSLKNSYVVPRNFLFKEFQKSVALYIGLKN
jgi:hypothetical protein